VSEDPFTVPEPGAGETIAEPPLELRAGRLRGGGACALGVCDGSGFVIDEQTNTARDCGCRAGRIAGAKARGLEARIPKRYLGVSFERPPVSDIARSAPEQVRAIRRYVRAIGENLDAGRGLWIQGDVGTGKTTLAMLISKAALEAGRSVAIYSLPRLLNLLRESLDSDSGKLDLIDRLTAVDLLHVDDLGAEHQTDWVLEQLYSIVNARYEAERAVLATTNLMPDELDARLGARTVSRLVEICGDIIPLFGDDKRREFRVAGDELARTLQGTGTPQGTGTLEGTSEHG
jgi:DNA replication protein DnaC